MEDRIREVGLFAILREGFVDGGQGRQELVRGFDVKAVEKLFLVIFEANNLVEKFERKRFEWSETRFQKFEKRLDLVRPERERFGERTVQTRPDREVVPRSYADQTTRTWNVDVDQRMPQTVLQDLSVSRSSRALNYQKMTFQEEQFCFVTHPVSFLKL